jgi:molybdopterin molybdotransferase
MSQFLKVKSPREVMEILRHLKPLPTDKVELEELCGRVLSCALIAPESVPQFPRAVMDGYAVRARDTFGASENLPALLEVSGEITMGRAPTIAVKPGQAVAIPTGGMLPAGADAVVMVEYTCPLDETSIEVIRPVAPGDNMISAGDDMKEGEELFPAGWRLRPQDVGVLAALGINFVEVHRRPRVAVLSTGDEVVPASTAMLPPGKIRDINTFTLVAQLKAAGAEVGRTGLVRDDLEALVARCRESLEDHDVLVLSGGSSVGSRDFTVRILDSFDGAELLVHGVAVRPGKPTILARMGEKLFWGLPGQPVSALMICRSFVLPSIAALQNRAPGIQDLTAGTCRAILGRKLPSVTGRADYFPVVLLRRDETLVADPVFGNSAMISTLGRADGYIVVPEHTEGLDRNTEVTVHLFSSF